MARKLNNNCTSISGYKRELLRVLAIEPIGSHKSFNNIFLRSFRAIGHVTLVAPQGYLESCRVDARIDIPAPLLRHKTKVGARWSAIRVLHFIQRNICLKDYDIIVFLAYETISFFISWPRSRKVFLFEHNNIDNASDSWVKMFFYRHLLSKVTHLTFQKHIAQHIGDICGRRAVCIPLPCCRADVSDFGVLEKKNTMSKSFGKRKIVFSPSSSTPQSIQDELKKFVTREKDVYYAICKGKSIERSDAWEVQPFFEKFENLLSSCDIVFFGAHFDYRVSGVAYEALSYGKPLVLLNCSFARELHDEYPHMVFIIKEMADIQRIEINQEQIEKEQKKFLSEHSFDTVSSRIKSALF